MRSRDPHRLVIQLDKHSVDLPGGSWDEGGLNVRRKLGRGLPRARQYHLFSFRKFYFK